MSTSLWKQHIETDIVKVWKNRGGFWSQPVDLLSGKHMKSLMKKGMHLRADGYVAYWSSVKWTVTKGVQKLHSFRFRLAVGCVFSAFYTCSAGAIVSNCACYCSIL